MKDLPVNSHVKLTKICDLCGNKVKNQLYQAILRNRDVNGIDKCRDCSYKTSSENKKRNIPFEKSIQYYALSNNMEYLIREYSDKNQYDPSKINHYTLDEVFWKCPLFGEEHEYLMRVRDRIHTGLNCPYCSNYRVNHTNCLATIHPELAGEWHDTLNEDMTPYNTSYRNPKKVWWKCLNGHPPFEQSVYCRSRLKYGCPECFGTPKKTTEQFKQEVFNLVNDEYIVLGKYIKSNVKILIKHSKCDFEYFVAPSNFLNGNRCPKCKESKGESKISSFLDEKQINYKTYFKFDNLLGIGGRKLTYDFYLPSYNLAIEYQGNFHDGSGGEFTEKNLEYVQEHDERKRKYSLDNNINFLEIWYWDFDNIEKILCEKLQIKS